MSLHDSPFTQEEFSVIKTFDLNFGSMMSCFGQELESRFPVGLPQSQVQVYKITGRAWILYMPLQIAPSEDVCLACGKHLLRAHPAPDVLLGSSHPQIKQVVSL
jgi:hypothetical protein